VRWSGRPKTYDLDSRVDRLRVYEQVLREGTDDVRRFIDIDELIGRRLVRGSCRVRHFARRSPAREQHFIYRDTSCWLY
jgi:hypothetical protein